MKYVLTNRANHVESYGNRFARTYVQNEWKITAISPLSSSFFLNVYCTVVYKSENGTNRATRRSRFRIKHATFSAAKRVSHAWKIRARVRAFKVHYNYSLCARKNKKINTNQVTSFGDLSRNRNGRNARRATRSLCKRERAKRFRCFPAADRCQYIMRVRECIRSDGNASASSCATYESLRFIVRVVF